MQQMSRRERIQAAINRQPVDRVPYAVWRHFPAVDRSPAGLAQATLRFHDHYGSDFLKITPHGGYAVEAWGCDVPAERSVTGASDWVSLLAQPARAAATRTMRAAFFMVVSLLSETFEWCERVKRQLVGMGPQAGSWTSPAAEVSRWRTRPSPETAASWPRPPAWAS